MLAGTSDLERALHLFDQHHRDHTDPHYLVIPADLDAVPDLLVWKMLRTLLQVASDNETQQQMAVEDEVVHMISDLETERAQKEEERRLKEAALARIKELEESLAGLDPN